MTCCDAMRKLIEDWNHSACSRPPGEYIYPSLDGSVRCHLCGAEWGPVNVADQILELQAELSDCRTKFAAEIRENSELKREVAYWKMMQPKWRPIESAPMDGREIFILCAASGNAYVASWEEGDDGGWCHSCSGFALAETPTHWMPIPETDEQTKHDPSGQKENE